MKKLLIFFVALATGITTSFAQSMLKVSMTDRSVINVSVDGRYFNKSGQSVTVGDLPSGKHYIQIFTTSEDRRGRARQEIVYDGKVKTSQGLITVFVYDPNSGQADIQQQDMSTYVPPVDNNPAVNGNYSNNGSYNNAPVVPQSSLTNDKINSVKDEVAAKNSDTQKMNVLKDELKGETYTTDQVSNIMGWFIFESSKVDFAEWAFPNTVDKGNFHNLDNQFQYKESQDNLDKFLQAQQK